MKLAVDGGRVVNVSVEYEDVAALARDRGDAGEGGPARRDRGRGGRLPRHGSARPLASRRSASSGETSSTRVMTAQRCPNGS